MKVFRWQWDNISCRDATVWRLSGRVFVVLEFDHHFLHDGRTVVLVPRPHGRLAHDGTVERRRFGEDGHARTILGVPFRRKVVTQLHDVRPRQANELRRIVFVLYVVAFVLGVEPLHGGQYPAPVLVRSRYLGGHLLPRSRRVLSPSRLLGPSGRRGRHDARPTGVLDRLFAPLQLLQESVDGVFLRYLQRFEVPRHRHGQFRRGGIVPDGDG